MRHHPYNLNLDDNTIMRPPLLEFLPLAQSGSRIVHVGTETSRLDTRKLARCN